MALLYKDGKLAPAAGDVVLGPRLKGRVKEVGEKMVVVRSKAPHESDKQPGELLTELDPATLTLLKRGPAPKAAPNPQAKTSFLDRLKMGRRGR